MSAVSEHKKALTQAEKLEQEFVALMTGQAVRGHEVAKTTKVVPIAMATNIQFYKFRKLSLLPLVAEEKWAAKWQL